MSNVVSSPEVPRLPRMLRARDLRRNRALAPGGESFTSVVDAFLPLVYGCASRLLPESPATQEVIASAVFRLFIRRWRKLPKKTLLASWFLRTTWFAARQEGKRSKSLPPARESALYSNYQLVRTLGRYSPRWLDLLILKYTFGFDTRSIGLAFHRRERRVEKGATRGLHKLTKTLRRRGVNESAAALMASLCAPVPSNVAAAVGRDALLACDRPEEARLAKSSLRSWRWFSLRRRLRRLAVAATSTVLVLAVLVATTLWLGREGFLTQPLLRFVNHRLVKEMPELAQSARPYPDPAAAEAQLALKAPRHSRELYVLTNVWRTKLSFVGTNWSGIQPSRIPTAKIQHPDGTMTLRNPKARRSGLSGVIGLDFNWVEARLEFAGADFPKVGVRYRGNGTYVNSLFGPKQSFKVDLNRFTKGQHLAGIHTLNFLNAIPDFSYVRDALAERLFRDLGVPAPRATYAYLTVKVSAEAADQPLGLYVLMENIDGDFADERLGTKDAPIFKPVTTRLFEELGPDWSHYADIYDLKTKATPAQRARLVEFAQLVSKASDAEFARRLPDYLDLEEFAAFLAGHVLLASYDGFLSNGQNYYAYLDPRSNRFGLISWDQDHSWGEFGYIGTAEKREQASIWQPSTYPFRFLERVLKVEAFRTIYRRTLEHALADLFTPERLGRQIDELAAAIRPAIAAESDFRLKRFELSISTNWLAGPRDGAPEGPKAPVHQIKRFIANRAKSVRDQLDERSQGIVLSQPHW